MVLEKSEKKSKVSCGEVREKLEVEMRSHPFKCEGEGEGVGRHVDLELKRVEAEGFFRIDEIGHFKGYRILKNFILFN